MNTPSSLPRVEFCFRCGRPADLPAADGGQIGGKQENHLPVCLACIELLLSDAEAFWRLLRERRKERPGPSSRSPVRHIPQCHQPSPTRAMAVETPADVRPRLVDRADAPPFDVAFQEETGAARRAAAGEHVADDLACLHRLAIDEVLAVLRCGAFSDTGLAQAAPDDLAGVCSLPRDCVATIRTGASVADGDLTPAMGTVNRPGLQGAFLLSVPGCGAGPPPRCYGVLLVLGSSSPGAKEMPMSSARLPGKPASSFTR